MPPITSATPLSCAGTLHRARKAEGFNVHAGVALRAGDREGLERLLRYCARPPFSLERLSLLSDGRVAYLLRKARRNGATHLVLEPTARMLRETLAKNLPDAASPVLAIDGGASPERDTTSEDTAKGGPRTSLGAGIANPAFARIDWASLVRRVYLDDVLACPCGGRRRVLADIGERGAIAAILLHMGLPTEPPPIARARSPGFEAA